MDYDLFPETKGQKVFLSYIKYMKSEELALDTNEMKVFQSNGCMLERSPVTENIKKVMALGSSITWREALEIITGSIFTLKDF